MTLPQWPSSFPPEDPQLKDLKKHSLHWFDYWLKWGLLIFSVAKCFSSHWEIDVFKEEEARSDEKWEEINHWLSENTLFTAAYFSNLRFQTPYYYNRLNFLCLDILKAWLQDGTLSKAYHLPNDTIKEFPANQENISYENIWMQFIWGQTPLSGFSL